MVKNVTFGYTQFYMILCYLFKPHAKNTLLTYRFTIALFANFGRKFGYVAKTRKKIISTSKAHHEAYENV